MPALHKFIDEAIDLGWRQTGFLGDVLDVIWMEDKSFREGHDLTFGKISSAHIEMENVIK